MLSQLGSVATVAVNPAFTRFPRCPAGTPLQWRCRSQTGRSKEVIPIETITTAMAIAMLCIAFATLVVKIIEVSRK